MWDPDNMGDPIGILRMLAVLFPDTQTMTETTS